MVKKAVAVQVSLCVRNGTASVCYIKGQMQGRDFSLGRESGGNLRGFEGCSGAEMGKKPSEWGNWGLALSREIQCGLESRTILVDP